MQERNFKELFGAKQAQKKFVCIGIDPDLSKIPERFRSGSVEDVLVQFCYHIIHKSEQKAGAYKLNLAFFLAHGSRGIRALERVMDFLHTEAPSVPVIIDSKMGDIGNSSAAYAHGVFDTFKADAVTLNPYLGHEALKSFLDREDKGTFILCHTSNPGASEFQELNIDVTKEVFEQICHAQPALRERIVLAKSIPLFHYVAWKISERGTWNKHSNCGLVVGATYPNQLENVRSIVGDHVSFLIPGVGAQGGDLEKSVTAGRNSAREMFLVNSSREIIYADDPGIAASALDDQITAIQGAN